MVQQSDNLLIESKCALCGFRIVGSAAGMLEQEELEHAARCPKKQSRAAGSN